MPGPGSATRTGLPNFLRKNMALVYATGVLGAFLQVSGGTWDVASHALGIPDTFFTPSHTILYAGIGLAGLAVLAGLLLRRTVFRRDASGRTLVGGLQIALVGTVLQLVAGPADFWWHEAYGFDPFLLTPSHSLLIVGIVFVGFGMAVGSARLLRARAAGVEVGRILGSASALRVTGVVALAALWLGLNGFVYLVTDVPGIAYTFQLGSDFVRDYEWVGFTVGPVALAFTGALVFLGAKRLVGRTGAASAVTVLFAATVGLGNVGFRATYLEGTQQGAAIFAFLPLYVGFVTPVLLFDLALRHPEGRLRTLIGVALVAPFASFLDGWHGTFLWTAGRDLLPLYIVPMMFAGLAAGVLSVRFEEALLARARPVAAAL